MLDYLKDLLEDLKEFNEGEDAREYFIDYHQKVFSLETAIDILTKIKNNERSVENGNIK